MSKTIDSGQLFYVEFKNKISFYVTPMVFAVELILLTCVMDGLKTTPPPP